MKTQRVKKITVALLVTCTLFVVASFAALAATNSQGYGVGWGRSTVKYDGHVDWTFYSTASPSRINTTTWQSAAGVSGASVTAKRAVISESTPAMSIGYMSCSYFGESIFSNKMIVNQMANTLGDVRTSVVYGTLLRSE